MEYIGKTLRVQRTSRDMKLKELSELSKLSVSYLSDIENNRKTPSLASLEKIAHALNVPVSTFLSVRRTNSSNALADAEETTLKEISKIINHRLSESKNKARSKSALTDTYKSVVDTASQADDIIDKTQFMKLFTAKLLGGGYDVDGSNNFNELYAKGHESGDMLSERMASVREIYRAIAETVDEINNL